MSNHKVEAMNYLIASTIDTHGDDDRKVAIAQVHATLYLAEQQRIGNLIALGSMQTSKETWATSARDEWVDEALSALADREPREGLGLK